LVLGTWDLNAPNSLSDIGVWWSATGAWKIYKGKK